MHRSYVDTMIKSFGATATERRIQANTIAHAKPLQLGIFHIQNVPDVGSPSEY